MSIHHPDAMLIGQFCETRGGVMEGVISANGHWITSEEYMSTFPDKQDRESIEMFLVRALAAQQFNSKEFNELCVCHTIMQRAIELSDKVVYGAFIYYFLTHDVTARGYIRNFMFIYLSVDIHKLMQFYSSFSRDMEMDIREIQTVGLRNFQSNMTGVLDACEVMLPQFPQMIAEKQMSERDATCLRMEYDALVRVKSTPLMKTTTTTPSKEGGAQSNESAMKAIGVLLDKSKTKIGMKTLKDAVITVGDADQEAWWEQRVAQLSYKVKKYSLTLLQLSLLQDEISAVVPECVVLTYLATKHTNKLCSSESLLQSNDYPSEFVVPCMAATLCIGDYIILNTNLGSLRPPTCLLPGYNERRFQLKTISELMSQRDVVGSLRKLRMGLGDVFKQVVAAMLRGQTLVIRYDRLPEPNELRRMKEFVSFWIPGKGCTYNNKTEIRVTGESQPFKPQDLVRYAAVITTSEVPEIPGIVILQMSASGKVMQYKGIKYQGILLGDSPVDLQDDMTWMMHLHTVLHDLGMRVSLHLDSYTNPENLGLCSVKTATDLGSLPRTGSLTGSFPAFRNDDIHSEGSPRTRGGSGRGQGPPTDLKVPRLSYDQVRGPSSFTFSEGLQAPGKKKLSEIHPHDAEIVEYLGDVILYQLLHYEDPLECEVQSVGGGNVGIGSMKVVTQKGAQSLIRLDNFQMEVINAVPKS